MDGKSVLLLGATGLVGSECLRQLIQDERYTRIVVLTRRPLEVPPASSKIEQHTISFDEPETYLSFLKVDQVICALGATIKKAKTIERFRIVDYTYPLTFARLALEQGAEHFLLVSASGASSKSSLWYSRVKGELEEALQQLPYKSITIVKPSLLLGERSEFRMGEYIGRKLGNIVGCIVPLRYRPIHAQQVASVLVQAGRENRPGVRIIENTELHRLAGACSPQ